MSKYDERFIALDSADADSLLVRWNIGVDVWNDTEVLGVSGASIAAEWKGNKTAKAHGMTTAASVSQHKKMVVKFESFDDMVEAIKAAGLPYSFTSARTVCQNKPSTTAKVEEPKVARRFSAKREARSLVAELGADKARKLAESILAELDDRKRSDA